MNGYAERFMIIALVAVTDQILIFGDRHLHSILAEHRPTTTEDNPVAAANSGRRSPTTIIADPPPEPIRRRPALAGLDENQRAR